MKRILYILLGSIALIACQQNVDSEGEGCVLELDVACANMPVVVSRSVDSHLAVTFFNAEGEEYLHYPAGSVPGRIVLEPGNFTICAYTENQDSWHTANNGKGEACYYAIQEVEMKYDHLTRITLTVPMTNYAVGVELPELFDELFSSYQFTLKSGTREVDICEGEMVYFDIADGGFIYALNATNIDGVSHTHSPISFTNVQSGKCYLLNYGYGFDEESVARAVPTGIVVQ